MVRDYCYVKDIAQASMAATATDGVGIYNIGTGRGTTTLELYRGIVRALRSHGVEVPVAFDEPLTGAARPGDIHVSTLDAARAGAILGWKPAFGLDQGLIETVGWYLNR
jgi:UDP-glucose 4-epimerase